MREIEARAAELSGGKTVEQLAEEARLKHLEAQQQMGWSPDPPSQYRDPAEKFKGEVIPFNKEFLPVMVNVALIGGKAAKIIAEVAESGEPIFILRAKDIFSVMAVQQYIELLEKYGPEARDMQIGASEQSHAMKEWQRKNVGQVRYPD